MIELIKEIIEQDGLAEKNRKAEIIHKRIYLFNIDPSRWPGLLLIECVSLILEPSIRKINTFDNHFIWISFQTKR